MIVTRVILQDYGAYRGKHEFDFTCTRQKPIVLIGGTNGAGKTTLFESIMLCLYGVSSIKAKSTQKTYGQFLARKTHRYLKSAKSARQASVTVWFKFFHNGKETEYCVERSWQKEEGQVHEQLTVKKRDSGGQKFRSLETVEQSHWQSFVEGLIPRGIIRLFFFDGEKIVKMAKEGREDATIRDAFKSLLGIEIVEQLRADLQTNLTRHLTRGDKALQEDYERQKAYRDEHVSATRRLRDRLAQKQNEMDSLRLEIENRETQFSKIGGKFASSRSQTKAELASNITTYENAHQKIIEMCHGTLPFSMIPSELAEMDGQIRRDEDIRQQQAGKKLLDVKLEKIESKIKTRQFWKDSKIDVKSADAVIKKISKLVNNEKIDSKSTETPKFDLSTEQSFRILNIIADANTTSLENLKAETKKAIQIGEKVSKLEASITNAPNDDEIGALVSEITALHSSAGALEAEMDHIQEKISANDSLKKRADSKLRDMVSQIYKNEKSRQGVQMTQDVQKVLDMFIEKLKVKKIHLLEEYLLEAIKTLMHKKQFVESVRVDPHTFEVTLFRKNNDPFPKDLLSEGEKQMFATAILWALAKTSGRPLPFMIDTPLARLDQSHRTNIVEKFLPMASHQVLIFSTDKEIELDDFTKLAPHLMRSYAMEYLEDEGATQKHDGYFWNKEGEKIVAV